MTDKARQSFLFLREATWTELRALCITQSGSTDGIAALLSKRCTQKREW